MSLFKRLALSTLLTSGAIVFLGIILNKPMTNGEVTILFFVLNILLALDFPRKDAK